MVQWLRLCTSNAGCMGLIPGWGTQIPHAAWHGPNKQEKNLKRNEVKICKISDVSQYMIIGKVIIKCSRSRKAQFCPNKYVVQANHTLPVFC